MSVLDFKIETPENLPTKLLGDVEKDLVSATVGFNPTLPPLGVVTFKLSASANGKIEAYNEVSDIDEDGVLSAPPEAADDDFGPVVLPPQIELNNQAAWLKYRFEAGVSASASATVFKNLNFKIDAAKKVIFADYHVHQRDEITATAALNDATRLRFTGNADDAFELAAKEALYYQVRGEFSGSVSISWSDVFTFGLNEISTALRSNELLMVNFDVGASVEFNVGVIDDFQLVVTKGTGMKIKVALKKAKARQIGVSAGVDFGAEFANKEQAEEFLNSIYEATLGQPLSKVKALLDRPQSELNKLIEDLPNAAKQLVKAIMDRLKITSGLQTLQDFKEQIESLEEKIKSTIKTIATQKAKVSFKYEYLRVRSDDTLFIVQLDREKYKELHKDLMLCDYTNLLAFARENKSSVERFLNQKELSTKESWGFTLGIGKWNLFGSDEKIQTAIIQTDLDENQRIAYRFRRGYKASFGEKYSWTVDFKAEMKDFAASPTACNFEYGLHFARTFEDKLKKDDLLRVFDDAVIWQAVHPNGLNSAIEKIDEADFLGKKAKAVTQFIIKDSTLRQLLPFVETADNDSLMASALAMAMAYDDNFKTRSRGDDLINRELAYAPLWRSYFQHPELDGGSYALMAFNHIRNQSFSDAVKLSEFERGTGLPAGQPVFTMRLQTFSGAIHFHHKSNVNSTINDFRRKFINGLLRLNKAIKNCEPHAGLNDIYVEMRPFFTQNLYVRAAGVYLMRLAFKNGLLGEINRSCTVAYADKTFAFGKSDVQL